MKKVLLFAFVLAIAVMPPAIADAAGVGYNRYEEIFGPSVESRGAIQPAQEYTGQTGLVTCVVKSSNIGEGWYSCTTLYVPFWYRVGSAANVGAIILVTQREDIVAQSYGAGTAVLYRAYKTPYYIELLDPYRGVVFASHSFVSGEAPPARTNRNIYLTPQYEDITEWIRETWASYIEERSDADI